MNNQCRVCDAPIEPFMSFGKMPIANGFRRPDQSDSEYFFELMPAFCADCGSFQIIEQPNPEQMFHDEYAFFSGTSRHMAAHFKAYADTVQGRYLTGTPERADPFVVEIGSNDGILIGNFAAQGYRHLGIEPSGNVAAAARDKGVQSEIAFFTPDLAEQIVAKHGQADLVVAANVICHIPDVRAVATGVATLLKPDGVFVFEEPYLGAMLTKHSYDQIYDEHVFIFSLRSVTAAFRHAGLEVIDVEHQSTHGGSMRYSLAKAGARQASDSVAKLRVWETEAGLDSPETMARFRADCEASRDALVTLLDQCKRQSKRVVGYGATSKSTTVLNYCGIGADQIEYISDTTPTKQGKVTPGTHIPVDSPDRFHSDPPDFAVLFAWNHKNEIFAKEQSFVAAGGRWITFVPKVEVVSA